MTHYWWMHWFWITFYLTSTCFTDCSSPSPASKVASVDRKSSKFEPVTTTETSNSNTTILSESLQTDRVIISEDNTSVSADIDNATVIVTQSKELVSCDQNMTETSWTVASITGICVGVVAVAIVLATISLVLYRRRYLNKPHALNDKCSNPDSSGYIDDSTMRENSEEMYSLDNDSFLNSLEAMTIQNYWTDNVKHTKL